MKHEKKTISDKPLKNATDSRSTISQVSHHRQPLMMENGKKNKNKPHIMMTQLYDEINENKIKPDASCFLLYTTDT